MREEEEENQTPQSARVRLPKFIRILGRIFLFILLFFVAVVLFIRSPWGQDIIVNKVTSYISNKTNTTVEVDKLFITFAGDIALEGLFMDDKSGDTLVYARSMEADIPIWPLISGGDIAIDAVDLNGLRANFIRKDTISGFNFQFLADAFATAPDSTAVPTATDSTATQNIILGDFNLRDIDIVFNDDVSGIESKYVIGELELSMEHSDLENMTFKASELILNNANLQIIQKPKPFETEEESAPLPKFSVGEAKITETYINFNSTVENLALQLDIDQFEADIPTIDLDASFYELNKITLLNSKVVLNTETEIEAISNAAKAIEKDGPEPVKGFQWPAVGLDLNDIYFENNYFLYTVGGAKPGKGEFNPNAVELTQLNLNAPKLLLKDQSAMVNIESAKFNETSGIDVNRLSVNAEIDDSKLEVNDINLRFNNNSIDGDFRMDYPSLNAMMENPESASLSADLKNFNLDIKELYKFQPDLRNNPNIQALSKKNLSGNLRASGNLSQINIERANVNWGSNTRISASGIINNATDPENLTYNFSDFTANSTRADLKNFVDEEEFGIKLPENVALEGNFSGTMESIDTNIDVTTSQGIATLNGKLNFGDELVYEGSFDIQDFNIEEFLGLEGIGPVNLTLDTKGKGNSIYNLTAEVRAEIERIELNEHTFRNVVLNGNLENGKGIISSEYKDEALNAKLSAYVQLDSVATEASIKLNITGANVQKMGLSTRDIRTGFVLTADFKGDIKDYQFDAEVEDGVVVYDNKTYLLGDIHANAFVKPDTTSFDLRNKLIDFNIQSNTDPQRFATALQKHVYSYFYRDVILSDTIVNPVNVKFDGHIAQAPILSEVFMVNLKDIDTVDLKMDFAQKERKLTASITAPHINYSSIEIDSLAFNMKTDNEAFNFDLNFNEINAGPLAIKRTELTGNQVNNELDLEFTAYHEDEKLIHIITEITGSRDNLRVHVRPDSLIFNKHLWKTPPDNEMRYLVDHLEFNNFEFEKNMQSVRIVDDKPGYEEEHVAIAFENFKLSEFLNYLNPDEKLATGNLNGDLILEKPLTDTGILADLSIVDLSFMDVDMGTLQMNGNALGGNAYAFNLDIGGGEVELDLVGDYIAEDNQAKLDLNLRIQEIKMSALNGFSQGEIKDGSGSFNGGFKLTGTLLEPQYNGSLTFNDADFTIARLNAPFTLPNETINVDNEGISMSNFTIRDENGNSLVASGNIGTETYINPTFNLEVKANNFKALDATEEDNDFMYGLAVFDAEAQITGDLQIPVVRGNATVLSETNITYVMPASSVNLEEREGIVVFVNKDNPDSILTQSEEQVATVKGFDINTSFRVEEGAAVRIIIDEDTGDNFRVTGEGDFDFSMLPNGRMSLAGVYDISGGHYEMFLYNLVNRRFLLAEGSKIRWSGDPFDAALDITAIYEIETSAAGLMAARTAGSDIDDRTEFKQVLPFFVYLNIDGELMAPKISFALDMPEDEQGAIGGEVYGRVQEINSQEAELNKQVFSLLVLNKFYPEPGSDGSRGGFASIARDNLNDALADQLNVVSDKLLGNSGINLDFNLDTFTDYQGESPQERTQLDIAAQKKLFDDRVIVRVGSEVDVQGSSPTGESTPLIGNVSLEYVLTNDGRYRLKGFRRNEFENVIDGQTIVSGIALIFTQEFNKFNELWDALVKSKTAEEKREEEKIKEAQKKLDEKDEKLKEEREKKNMDNEN